MAIDYTSPAQKGMKLNAILLWFQTLFKDPKLQVPSETLIEVGERVRQSQDLINEIAGTRINIENPVVGSVSDPTIVALVHAAGLELQMLAGRRLGDKLDRVEFIFNQRMRNIVIGKMYRLIGRVYTKRGEIYYLGLSDLGHYVMSDESNWAMENEGESPDQAAP